MKTYTRAIKLKLFSTKSKQRKIEALIHAYRKAVNFYLISLTMFEGKLDKETLGRLTNTKLSERYKSNALKQALGIHKACLKTKRKIPEFNGYPILDAKFINIQAGKNTFDLWIKTSNLAKRKPLYLPTKKYQRLNYWLNKGELIQGCELHKDKVIVWVKINKEKYKEGKSLGIDIGMNKLIATNEKQYLGKRFNELNDKILRKTKNSKAYKRSIKELNNYINQTVNQLPWNDINVLVYENLKNITKGSKGKRQSKKFRVKQQHWAVGKLKSRILFKCEENRVRPIYVNPYNTSRTCPSCGNVDEANRSGEYFSCLACDYKEDADFVGATNILERGLNWLRSLESLNSKGNII